MGVLSLFIPTINDEEYHDLSALIKEQTGINLGETKKELVKARLSKRIRHLGLKSFRAYYDHVTHDRNGDELVELVNAISTNVTSFFREDTHYTYLKNVVFPILAQKNKKERRLRIWSAACSSGEEVYSLLMTVFEYFPDALAWDIKVLGTDISTKVLSVAQEGIYPSDRIKNIPPIWCEKYLELVERSGKVCYRMKDKLLQRTVFARLNLLAEKFPFSNKMDVIFCRNVMIYFDRMTRGRVVRQLHRALKEEGHLFVGHSESLLGLGLGFSCVAPAVYKKNVETHP